MSGFPNFSEILIAWYHDHKRDLPWRKTKDPYIIWVSEIILQQTRVEQGISYFNRFLRAFPTVETLAKAEEQDVLNLWQGLGYYSRARNMHKSAKIILSEHNGEFPKDYDSIRKLSGIGDYTAAAITSFAYKMPYPVIDGNVIRLITRLFGIDEVVTESSTKKLIASKTKEVFSKKEPDTFNQAIMEFGALHCTSSKPDCENCPFSARCVSFNTGMVNIIPMKKKANKKRNRYFNYAVIKSGNSLVLRKRNQKDIWQNMYDFPMIENKEIEDAFHLKDLVGLASESIGLYNSEKISDWKIHILSHQKIHARFHEFDLSKVEIKLADDWELTEIDEIENYPLPKLIESYINGM